MLNFANMIDFDKPFFVCCSGGVDSVAATAFLAAHGRIRKNRSMSIFHFNHNSRPQNDAMQRKVEELGRYLCVPVVTRKAAWKVDEKKTEDAFRQKRICAYNSVGGVFVIAHHLDDCVESSFMKWTKGIHTLPMPIKTKFVNATIIRPFLLSEKAEMIDYVHTMNLNKFIEADDTNNDSKYTRNYVRNELLPNIHNRFPGIKKVIKKQILEAYKSFLTEKTG